MHRFMRLCGFIVYGKFICLDGVGLLCIFTHFGWPSVSTSSLESTSSDSLPLRMYVSYFLLCITWCLFFDWRAEGVLTHALAHKLASAINKTMISILMRSYRVG